LKITEPRKTKNLDLQTIITSFRYQALMTSDFLERINILRLRTCFMKYAFSSLKFGLLLGCSLVLVACDSLGGLGSTTPSSGPDAGQLAAAQANISSLSEVIQRNPNSADDYNTRGSAYAGIQRYTEAIADFTKATQLNPNLASAYSNRATANRAQRRDEAALADYNRAIEVGPNYAPAYLGRGKLRRQQNDLSAALADISKAIQISPDMAEAYHERGLVF
jgi:tetratricopeptide (TPR) repeat protein